MIIDYIHLMIRENHFENNIVYDMYHNEILDNIQKHRLMDDKMVKFYELYLMLGMKLEELVVKEQKLVEEVKLEFDIEEQ
jgi:hypothetical protein